MGTGVDVKQMSEDEKEFDRLYSGLHDSDDSDDEFLGKWTSMKEDVIDNHENDASCIITTSMEHQRENLSYDGNFLGMSAVGCKESVQEKRNALVEEIMKSGTGPDFGKLESILPYEKKQESAKGENWFNLCAPEVTEDLKKELDVLKMKAILYHKKLYKKNALKSLPKYFQVGAIVESPADFYSSHIAKKQRKQTMVEQLLADAEFQRHNKQRFKEIIEEQRRAGHHRGNKNKGKNKK